MTTQLRPTAFRGGIGVLVVGLVTTTALVTGSAAHAATPPVPVGTPPKAVITVPSRAWAGIPITLSGAKSTASGGGVSEWEWDLDGNGRYERDSLSSPWVSKAFKKGTHTVKLRVRNETGLVATATKTFTVKTPPAATGTPLAPAAVTATADGTAVDVTWQAPLGASPLTYRVSNGGDLDTDPIYVPVGQPLSARFGGLIPGDYVIRVSGVNSQGSGPTAEATAHVTAKGAPKSTTSPSPTEPASGNATAPVGSDSVAPNTSASGSSSSDHRGTIGVVLIGIGAVVLFGAALTALVSWWRRRRTA